MLTILYEDKDIIVIHKPVGQDSQSSRSFAPDVVSEIKRHIHKTSTVKGEPYVGVIHRLDKPVSGVMVYAKTRQAASRLSSDLQSGRVNKKYLAVLCGKPVDNVNNYVDYLLKKEGKNESQIVNKGIAGAKRAELAYQVLQTKEVEGAELTLVEVELLTGRHHQIRVQFAGHGMPLWGDNRYNPQFAIGGGGSVALAAWQLSFFHPLTGVKMQFQKIPTTGIFCAFEDILILYKGSTNQK